MAQDVGRGSPGASYVRNDVPDQAPRLAHCFESQRAGSDPIAYRACERTFAATSLVVSRFLSEDLLSVYNLESYNERFEWED